MDTSQGIEMGDRQFAELREIIHANTGITIADGRKSLLLTRLRSRLREIDEPDFKAYIARVGRDRKELQNLIDRVTTNKTYFYRTPRIWDHFREVTVPAFREKGGRKMRVWSGAASTGDEAHTIGVVLEDVRKTTPGFDYAVMGTDVSARVLETAETGVYPAKAVAAFQKDNPELFRAHMLGDDAGGFKVRPEVKSRIKFKRHNLLEKLKGTAPFDAVFLRNVLIYFTHEDQETILRHVLDMMVPTGTLFIGESESINRLDTGFEPVEPLIYRIAARAGGAVA